MPKPDLEREVMLFLKKIPPGKVVTYKTIGQRFDIHPRVAGLIVSRNRHPELFPCFKVIHSNGELGGYSGVGGVRRKAELLRKDGIRFKKRINLVNYLWG